MPKPPFIIEEDGEGLQLDIIRNALSTQNISTNFEHVQLSRSILSFQQLSVDAISIVPSHYKHPSMFVSNPYITYQNVAVSLTNRELNINSIDDLSGLSVVAFQRAHKLLGEEFNYKVAKSSDYREIAYQREQIDKLFTGEAEVIILDINIFIYFCKRHKSAMYQNPFTIHHIFDERTYSAGFKSKALKEKFNKGIAEIKYSGKYKELLAEYY